MLFYDSGVVSQLHRIQEAYIAQSVLLDAGEWGRRSLASRTLQGVARLADSFL